MKYYVYLNTRGVQEVVFEGTKEECLKYEASLRKEISRKDPNRVEMDCYTMSAEEIDEMNADSERWNNLTKEQKHETVTIGGLEFVKAIVEQNGRLKTIRKARRLSVRDLADQSGVNFQMIQKYESGIKDINKAAASTVKALAKVLGCTMEELID